MPDAGADPGFWTILRRHLNFFRIHLLFFTFTPLICSVVLYASNGRYPIAYIDALYNSVSAVTVCGLGTVNLSQLTPWQQVLLFIQMCVGSPVVVSWFMVYIRRLFFAKKFEYIIQVEAARRAVSKTQKQQSSELATEMYASEDWSSTPREKGLPKKLRTDMIRRMDAPPKRVNPSGWISEGITMPLKRLSSKIGSGGGQEKGHLAEQLSSSVQIESR
ncbi:hypothetical protein J3R82DRAFT_3116 [Butyriboletus roseoflavus]|nr:hypothetical protein J3R82DRAFT_3116 [Butyriboletus roseoflavus]